MEQEEAEKILEKYGWQMLTGDVNWEDHGGTWCRRHGPGQFLVIETQHVEGDVHYVSLALVQPDVVDAEAMKGALSYADAAPEEELEVVWALYAYGAKMNFDAKETKTPVDDVVEMCRRPNPPDLGEALERVVNGVGSTGLDMLRGDPVGGLRRIRTGDAVNDTQALMLKMYAAADGRTFGGQTETELAKKGKDLL